VRNEPGVDDNLAEGQRDLPAAPLDG